MDYTQIMELLVGHKPEHIVIQLHLNWNKFEMVKVGKQEVVDLVASGNLAYFDKKAEELFDRMVQSPKGKFTVDFISGENYQPQMVARLFAGRSVTFEVIDFGEPVSLRSAEAVAS